MGNSSSAARRAQPAEQSEPVDDGSPPAPLTPLAGPASFATQNRVDGETPRPPPPPKPSSTAALAAAAPTLDLEPGEDDEDEDGNDASSPYAIDLDDVREAASRIEDHITHTPVRSRREEKA